MSGPRNTEKVPSKGSPRHARGARGTVAPAGQIGERFDLGRCRWPPGAEFALGPDGYELTLFHPAIAPEVIEAVRLGPGECALIVRPPVIVLAYRFGEAIPWGDTPYSWHLQPDSRRRVPEPDAAPGARALLRIALVGASDGIIHARGEMTLSPAFTRRLHDAIRNQAMNPFDPVQCVRAISSIYQDQVETIDRLGLAVARSRGVG